MDELLRGNYPLDQPKTDQPDAPSLEDQFELAALKRLGGSITFVARRKVVWADDPVDPAHPARPAHDKAVDASKR